MPRTALATLHELQAIVHSLGPRNSIHPDFWSSDVEIRAELVGFSRRVNELSEALKSKPKAKSPEESGAASRSASPTLGVSSGSDSNSEVGGPSDILSSSAETIRPEIEKHVTRAQRATRELLELHKAQTGTTGTILTVSPSAQFDTNANDVYCCCHPVHAQVP